VTKQVDVVFKLDPCSLAGMRLLHPATGAPVDEDIPLYYAERICGMCIGDQLEVTEFLRDGQGEHYLVFRSDGMRFKEAPLTRRQRRHEWRDGAWRAVEMEEPVIAEAPILLKRVG